MIFGARDQGVTALASRQQRSHQLSTYATRAKVVGCTPAACLVCSARNGEGRSERSDSSYPSGTYCAPNVSTPRASVGRSTSVRGAIVLDVAVVVLCVYLLWRHLGSTQRHPRTMPHASHAPSSVRPMWNASMLAALCGGSPRTMSAAVVSFAQCISQWMRAVCAVSQQV